MTRRVLFLSAPFLLVPLLAVVLVGFARGQGADEHQGDAGANPQPAKAEVPYLHTYVLDDWEHGVGGTLKRIQKFQYGRRWIYMRITTRVFGMATRRK